MNHVSLKEVGLDVMVSQPLRRTYFGQYQVIVIQFTTPGQLLVTHREVVGAQSLALCLHSLV